jgi:hypothetical protein
MDTDMAKLAERLGRLEDLEAIRTTWRDYCIQLDTGDMAGLGEVFTEDAILEMDGLNSLGGDADGVYRGRASIIGDFYSQVGVRAALNDRGRFNTGHISTNMQIDLRGDEATTLAYFFEIVADNIVLIGTYQHRFRRDPDRWRFAFLRIAVRYKARIEAGEVSGQTLREVLARPLQ